ncbi:MAG: glucosamine-6-phosphate deaminase [Chloroflexota bacterium]
MSTQFQVAQVQVEVHHNKDLLGQAAASLVGNHLRRCLAEKGQARLVLATGASQYEFLTALLQEKDIAWEKVTAFHLDEYIGLSEDHPASFRRYLRERVFDHLSFAAVHLLDGTASDANAEAQRYQALLAEAPIDIACIGIGENGHLAFNDPPADFETSDLVHVVELDEACRNQQVGEGHFASFADVPTHALSMSIPAILAADIISCVVPDERKADAVSCSLEGPISPTCPGSALRNHQQCVLFLDSGSASRLKKGG